MKYLLMIFFLLCIGIGCSDDENLVATSGSEFTYQLPQGDHDYDDRIVAWHDRCGFYLLYRFEPKDVYFNLDYDWQELAADTVYDNDGNMEIRYSGVSVKEADEKYVGEQLDWIESMLLNHYSDRLLREGLPLKLILGRELIRGVAYGEPEPKHYYSDIFNTLIFSNGDEAINSLSLSDKKEIKDNLNRWMLTDRLFSKLPDLTEFYDLTDYDFVLNVRSDPEYSALWKSVGCIISYPGFSTVEDAKASDLMEYIKMIISTPEKKLKDAPIRYDNYSGMLHPDKDTKGVIAKKYATLLRICKEWGVDLYAIGNLYVED